MNFRKRRLKIIKKYESYNLSCSLENYEDVDDLRNKIRNNPNLGIPSNTKLILKLQDRILKADEEIKEIDFTSATNKKTPLIVEISQ